MCVVKVNRVEGDSVRRSNKELLHSPPPVKTDPPAEPGPGPGPGPLPGSGEMSRTPGVPGQWSEAPPLHPGTNEVQRCSGQQQDLPTPQDGIIRTPPPGEEAKPAVSHPAGTADSEVCRGPSDSATQTSGRQDSCSQTPDSEDRMDTGPGKGHSTAAPDPSDRTSRCHTEALLHKRQPEPVGGGSSPSPHTLSPSRLDCSLEQNSSEENIFPPLLQSSSVDMPLLSPEAEEKPSICLLPPVLTQEMPSLTPAHDGMPPASRLTSCSNQIAPVLQREVPTGSRSSHAAKRDDAHSEGVKPERANSWHLALLRNGEAAAMSGNTANLPASVTLGAASAGVQEVLSGPDGAAETGLTKANTVCTEQGGVHPRRPLPDRTPPSEQGYISATLANTANGDPLGSTMRVLSPSSAGSLLNSASANEPAPNLDLDLLHPPTYSHCSSSATYIEPKPFSSSIWRNLNSHSPAVLIQSLNPELSSNFTSSDPLPYTIWTEPQCKEVTDLESSERELHLAEDQEEEGRPLTWAQLEPTSLVSVGTVEPLGLCGDDDLHPREAGGSEALSVCTQLGRKMEEGEVLQAGTVVAAPVRGGERHEEGSDLEGGASEAEEAEERCRGREEESSDLTDEEEVEEAFQCPQVGLEPGEVCAVSAHSCNSTLVWCDDAHFAAACLLKVPRTVVEEGRQELAPPTQETNGTSGAHCSQAAGCQ